MDTMIQPESLSTQPENTAPHRRCPVCGEDNQNTPVSPYSQAPWEIKTCSCGCVYLENPPAYAALEEDFAWEKTSHQEEERRKSKRPCAKYISTAWKMFRQKVLKRDKLMTLVRRYIHSGRVLDIGCGGGSTLTRLPSESLVPYGVEISKALAQQSDQFARARGGWVVQSDAIQGTRSFEPAFFEGVLMSAFLEHEAQPDRLLDELHRVLKPGGMVIIKVPNYGSLNRRFKGKEWCGFRFPDHVNYFTPASLTRLVREKGFSIRQFGFFDRLPTSDNLWMVLEK